MLLTTRSIPSRPAPFLVLSRTRLPDHDLTYPPATKERQGIALWYPECNKYLTLRPQGVTSLKAVLSFCVLQRMSHRILPFHGQSTFGFFNDVICYLHNKIGPIPYLYARLNVGCHSKDTTRRDKR
jgi:hypothetical protein